MARKDRKPTSDTTAARPSAFSSEAIAVGTAIGGLTLGAAHLHAQDAVDGAAGDAALVASHTGANVSRNDVAAASDKGALDTATPQQVEAQQATAISEAQAARLQTTESSTPAAPATPDGAANPSGDAPIQDVAGTAPPEDAQVSEVDPSMSTAATDPSPAAQGDPSDFAARVDAILDSALSATTGPLSSDIGGSLDTLTGDIAATVTESLDAALGGLDTLTATITGSVEALLDAPLGPEALDLSSVMEAPGDIIASVDGTVTLVLPGDLLSPSTLTDIPDTLLGAETDALVPDLLSSLFYSDGQASETTENSPVSTAGEDFDAGLIDSAVSRILDDGPALMGLSYLDGNDGSPDAGLQHGGIFGI